MDDIPDPRPLADDLTEVRRIYAALLSVVEAPGWD